MGICKKTTTWNQSTSHSTANWLKSFYISASLWDCRALYLPIHASCSTCISACISLYTYPPLHVSPSTRISLYTYLPLHVSPSTRISLYTYLPLHISPSTRISLYTYLSLHISPSTRISLYTYQRTMWWLTPRMGNYVLVKSCLFLAAHPFIKTRSFICCCIG